MSLEESALVYDFDRKTARSQLADVFRTDEEKADAKHVEDVEDVDDEKQKPLNL